MSAKPAGAPQDDGPSKVTLGTPATIEELSVQLRDQHGALLRMLGHLKDALRMPATLEQLYRAIALAGYNANRDPAVSKAIPGLKALWAAEDATALLAVGSEDPGEGGR